MVCQRCLQGFIPGEQATARLNLRRERPGGAACGLAAGNLFDGRRLGSLRELAEEELLLALPAPACSTPEKCGRAPSPASRRAGERDEPRPFARITGFIEENLIGQTTHGSSKKQKDPFEARDAPFPFGAGGAGGVDRGQERRDSFATSHFARWILSRQEGIADQGGCGSGRRIGALPAGDLLAARASSTHRVCAAAYCHRRHERRPRTVGFRSGGAAAAREFTDVRFTLIGRQADLQRELPGAPPPNVDCLFATEVVEMTDHPREALRRKKDSSMRRAIDLVKPERRTPASARETPAR